MNKKERIYENATLCFRQMHKSKEPLHKSKEPRN